MRPRTLASPAVFVENLVVLSGYVVGTLLMTYPLAWSLTSAIPADHQIKGWYPGDGDPWQYLWAFWYVKQALSTFPPSLFWTDLVFYPLGFEMPFMTGVGAILAPAALLGSFVSLTLTYNILWLLSFVLAGFTTYRLGCHLFRDRWVAFFCGHAFAFSAYRMAHALEHLPLVMASFLIPLFALCLLKAVEEPTPKRWVAPALVWAVSAGISWYCTIALLVWSATFALFLVCRHGFGGVGLREARALTLALGVAGIAAAPFVLPLLLSPAQGDIVNRPLSETNWFTADLLAFFLPSPRHPIVGRFMSPIFDRFTGNLYEGTVYLGYVVLALALVGLRRASRDKTRFFALAAAVFFVLALGPFLHVYGRYRWELDGETLSIPLPYLLLNYVPLVRGMRDPSRFAEPLILCLVVLAGYGLSAICARLETPRWRTLLPGVLLVGSAFETTSVPWPVLSTEAPVVYAEIGATPEPFTVLELPLDWRIIKYHYHQTIHGKRLLVGHPVRTREKYTSYPAGLPLVPLLREPRRLLDRPPSADDTRDAARLTDLFGVRYIVLHRRYLDPPVFGALDRFVDRHFPWVRRREDGEVVAYALQAADAERTAWPADYAIDFGAESRDFVLRVGWSWNERWGDTTVQWSSERESSLYVFLGEPKDRVLEVRMMPLTYPGSPRQTVTIGVNGIPHERLTLEREWTQYRLALPSTLFHSGLNTLTFNYGYTVAPAKVVAGGADTRRLAVAFDSLTLRGVR